MRSLAPELPVAGTHPLTQWPTRPSPAADVDTWSTLATQVAEATDPDLVAAAVTRLGAALGVDVDLDADIVVLQRTFGVLHRRAVDGA